jgi:phospholipid/cholesterol/gamma-HCH transport system substrate-binding protein
MVMNERVMQFRIGMFVIVAGLVLIMLIVWFGESPLLLRDSRYVTVHYVEAPGVGVGIPVRKSGIRIGEVAAVKFDDRPGQPDGVLVTLSIESQYKIKEGSVPRITRALIGDVSIDMLPGTGPGYLKTSPDRMHAPIIEGAVAPDPSNALVSATAALDTIRTAAAGISDLTKKLDGADELLTTWKGTGERLGAASDSFDRLIRDNETNFQPALANFRKVMESANATLDAQTQAQLKAGIDRFATASGRLDAGLADLQPLLKDLGAPVSEKPTTNFGWGILRFNRVLYDVSLLTTKLNDGNNALNPDGSLQKLVTRSDLHDNMNRMAIQMAEFFQGGRQVMKNLNTFAEKVGRDPSVISRGMLKPQ